MGELAYRMEKESYTNYDLLFCLYETGIARDFNLKQSTLSTLACLCRYYNPSTGVVFPSLSTIADKINAGERTVSRAIEELINKGLLLKIKNGKHNVYIFGNIFWQYIKRTAEKSNLVTCQKRKNTCQNDNRIPAILTSEHNKHEQNKEHTSYTNVVNKQEDYKKIDDVIFSKPSNIQEYKQTIEKLEAWNVLNPKTIIRHHKLERVKTIIEITESKSPNNPGAYFRSLLNVPNITTQKNTGIKNNVKDELPINRMVKCKYWKHIPTGRVLKALPEVGTHILFKYWKDSETVTFLFENDFTDKLENFTTDIDNNELLGR